MFIDTKYTLEKIFNQQNKHKVLFFEKTVNIPPYGVKNSDFSIYIDLTIFLKTTGQLQISLDHVKLLLRR